MKLRLKVAVLLAASAPGCSRSVGPPRYELNQLPPLVAQAEHRVFVMTLPIEGDPRGCFPQCYVNVRKTRDRVALEDVALYRNRRAWIEDGLVPFHDGQLAGFVDEHGKVVIEPRFTSARPFFCESALVTIDDRFGYVRKDGSWLIEPTLAWAYDFQHGFAAAKPGETYGILRTDGTWHVEPQFVRLEPLVGGLFAVRRNGEQGFFDPRSKGFITAGDLAASYKPPRPE